MAATTHTRIIVPLDGGPVAERAIPVATALAAQAALPITLVTVLSDSDVEDNAKAYLRARMAEIPALQVDVDVLRGMPAAHTLVEYFHRHPRSLVCCSTHARLDSKRFMLGSVAEELVRRAPVPVVLVGPRADLPGPDDRYTEVVVCAEDDTVRRVVSSVRDLSGELNLKPSVVQVVEPSYGARRTQGEHRSPLLDGVSQAFAADGIKVDSALVEDRNVPLAVVTFARERSAPLLALGPASPVSRGALRGEQCHRGHRPNRHVPNAGRRTSRTHHVSVTEC